MPRLGKTMIEMNKEADVGAARAALHELQIDIENYIAGRLTEDQFKILVKRWAKDVQAIRTMLGDIP